MIQPENEKENSLEWSSVQNAPKLPSTMTDFNHRT